MKSSHGFKILSSTLNYENPYTRVYEHEIERPNGTKGRYWVVQKENFPIVIPLFPDQTTILVGQYRLPIDEYSWEFPMGAVKNASLFDAAKQELREETGYIAKNWKELGTFFLANGWYENSASVYVATELTFTKKDPDEGEFLQTRKISLNEVAKMINSGTIKDGPTIVAFHYLEKYLQEKNI